MTAHAPWTPASRPGLIPLHPLSFGTILGRSFAALRQNPRVLLGFALVVQTVAYIVLILAIGGVAFASFSRLNSLQEGTDEWNAVLAGSIAIVAIVGLVLGLAAGALSVVVQAIVVTEVAHAAVAERLTLRALWSQLRPVVWRLLGYALLLMVAVLVVIGVVGLAIVGVAFAAPALAIVVGIPIVLAAVPLYWWLYTKLLLVPSAIILEHARIFDAFGRSWRLTRGRFWSSLGVVVIISVCFSAIAQVVSLPFSFLGSALTSIIAPTGDSQVSAIVGTVVVLVFVQILTLVIQSIALVVQSTATALIYIDCRMRHEGLDLDLLTYVEQRDAGATALADPYRVNVGRVLAPRPPVMPVAYPGAPGAAPYGAPYPPYGADPQPAYGAAPQPPYGAAAYPPAPAPYPPYGAAPQPPYPHAAPQPPNPQAPPPPAQWTPPGSGDDGIGADSR